MTTLLNKMKSLAIGLMALTFFVAVALGSCTPKEGGSEESEDATTEQVSEGGEEHPADSVASESEEHPSDEEEHPSDEEHPSEDEEEEGE